MTDASSPVRPLPAFLDGGGSCGALIAARDWSATLGSIEHWPQSLRTATAILLRSPVPMVLLWGVEGIMIYNDGYAGFSGGRHPELLGSKVREGWPEAADFNDNVMRVGLAGGTLAYKDMELTLYRSGAAEQVFMNLDYSPVPGDDGGPAGVLAVVVETTGRVLAERHRTAEHARLVKMYEQAPGIIAMLEGPRHVFVLANAAYRELIGQRDVIGLPVQAALPEVESQGFMELLDRVFATGEPFRGEAVAIQLARVQGQAPEERFLDFIYQPVTDERGQVAGIFVEGYDVTERVRASRLLEAFVEAVPGVVFAKDLEGRMLVANRGTADLIGKAPGEYIGRTDAEFLDDEAQARVVMATDRRIMESGVAEQIEELVSLPDGTLATWFSTKAPLRDAGGKVVGLVGSSIDITARKEVEERLRESEERYRMLFETIESGFCIVEVRQGGPDGRIDYRVVEANPAFYRQTGFPEGILGRWLREAAPELEEHWFETYGRVARTGEAMRFEQGSDLLGRWFDVYAFRLDKAGEGRVGILFNDISARRKAEDALRELNETLEHRVEEAIAARQEVEATLRQSQKMEAVGQLTGGIAHDFNNMLAAVMGSLDLLGRRIGEGDERARRYVEAAMEGTRRAATLTQRLLAFSRQQPLRPESIDVNRLVQGMSELLRRSLGASVQLETVLAGGLWRTSADPNQLENVILNLAVNARDAMPEGGRLTIETVNAHLDSRYAAEHLGVPAGQYVQIAVTDTGMGMSPEVIAKAFDPFFTTKPVGQGTGLGLSQVYGYVKQSGGHVKIYSEPGEGTAVKIYLPRLLGPLAEDAAEEAPRDLPRGEPREVVLVVEDEPMVRRFTVDALGALGYRVLEAGEAEAALRLLDAHPEVELLFTDVVMPGINGRRLADEALRRRPELKVLFTTGYTRNAVVHNGVLDPGVHLLGKPFTVEQLAAKLREVLDGIPARV